MEKEYYQPIIIKNSPPKNNPSINNSRTEQKQLGRDIFPGYKRKISLEKPK